MIKIILLLLFIINIQSNDDLICGRIPISIGICGDDCTFEFNHDEKKLTITGTKINDYKTPYEIPWYLQMDYIEKIIFDGITYIGKNSFTNTKSLTNITIPSTVINIEKNAFSGSQLKIIKYEGLNDPCKNNTFDNIKTTYASVVNNYEGNKFCGIYALKEGMCGNNCEWNYNDQTNELTIIGSGEMIDFIKESTPWNTHKNETKTISISGVSSIGNYAFEGFSNLEIVTISQDVITIGENSFSNCNKLTTINYKGLTNPCKSSAFNSVGTNIVYVETNYNGDTFCEIPVDKVGFCGNTCYWKYIESSSTLQIFGNGNMSDFDNVSPWNKYIQTITTITVSGITNIGSKAFKDCSKLTSTTISNSITKIGINPFIGCSLLTNVNFETDSTFKFIEGMILTRDETEIIAYLQSRTETDFIFLPDELKTIHQYAFYGNTYLQSVVIPLNVAKIGNYAFGQCTKLQNVYFFGCMSPDIGDNIFTGSQVNTIKVKQDCKDTVVFYNDFTIIVLFLLQF